MDGFGDDGDADGVTEGDGEEEEAAAVAPIGQQEMGGGPLIASRVMETVIDEDEFEVEDDPFVAPTNTLSKKASQNSHLSARSVSKGRVASPIGMGQSFGPGNGRQLSNALGQSMSGLSTGSASYA